MIINKAMLYGIVELFKGSKLMELAKVKGVAG